MARYHIFKSFTVGLGLGFFHWETIPFAKARGNGQKALCSPKH